MLLDGNRRHFAMRATKSRSALKNVRNVQAYIEQTLQTRLRHSYAVVSDTRQSS